MKNLVATVIGKVESSYIAGEIDLMKIDNDAIIKRFGKGFSTQSLKDHSDDLHEAIRRLRKHYWKESAVAKMV